MSIMLNEGEEECRVNETEYRYRNTHMQYKILNPGITAYNKSHGRQHSYTATGF